MDWDYYYTRNVKYSPGEPMIVRVMRMISLAANELGLTKKVDMESNGQKVNKLLRCAASGCFDKDILCCKACDIKKCRYKCNHLSEEVCEYQYLE